MRTRIITAALFIPVTLLLLLYSPLIAWISLAAIAVISLLELRSMFSRIELTLVMPLLLIYAGANLLIHPDHWDLPFFIATLAAYLLSIFCYAVLHYPGFSFGSLGANVVAAIYPLPLILCAIQLRFGGEGHLAVLLALMLTWGYDSFAFFGGSFWGRHFIFPELSPKKSAEGVFCGLLGSIVAEALFRYFFSLPIPLPFGLLAILAGLMAQIGDLIASLLKRYAGVKDSGNLFPGHGGILDRFDAFFCVVSLVTLVFYLGG